MIRLLAYYANVGFNYTVYVGDSSGEHHLEQTAKAVERFRAQLNIVHTPMPGIDQRYAISRMLHTAQETYAAFSGDDDFLVPASLDKCAQFLESNPDYATAHGVAAICGLEPQAESIKVTGTGRYGLRYVEGTSAKDRLTAYLNNFFSTVFSLHRIEDFRKTIDASLKLPDKTSFDLLSCCVPVVQGKSRQLDCFYLVRGVHARIVAPLDVFDLLTTPELSTWYPTFSDYISKELALQDGVTVDEAKIVVKQAVWSYLAWSMNKHLRARSLQNGTGYRSRFRLAARRNSAIRTAWRIARSYFPGNNNRMSLPALLRRSSPYHEDFLPIYQAISSPMAELTDRLQQ